MRPTGGAALALALAWAVVPAFGREPSPAREGQAFSGNWSVSGQRQAIRVDGSEEAAVVEVSGAVVLTADGSLGRGFSGRAIGYDDGEGRSAGRCVWTDAGGDQVFSRLEGGPFRGGMRLAGTITGGTGRYAGLVGDYSLTWQYVVSAEDGHIQGRAVDLAGRVRRAAGSR